MPATATATANGGRTVARIELFADNQPLGARRFSPAERTASATYTLNWQRVPVGTHALTARVTDSRGATGVTAVTVNFAVTQDASLTLPAPTIAHTAGNNASLVTISMPVPAPGATDAERRAFGETIRGAWILYTVATRDGSNTLVALDPATDKTAQYYALPFLVGLGEHIVAARRFGRRGTRRGCSPAAGRAVWAGGSTTTPGTDWIPRRR